MALQIEDIVKHLDAAADIFLNPSTGDEERKKAEQYFLQFKNAKVPVHILRQIIDNFTKEFVQFQAILALKEAILREWNSIQQPEIEEVRDYLLNFCVNRHTLSTYVIAEALRTVAVFMKRGTFDNKCGDTDRLFETATQWISTGKTDLQSLACRLLLSICSEYCTSWRSGNIGLSWDFHMRAKRVFEKTELRRVFELTLQILNCLMNAISGFSDLHGYNFLISQLLNVAEWVLNWNFSSKKLPSRLTCSLEFSPATCFKPDDTWRDLMLNSSVVQFMFELRIKVKDNEELNGRVSQCLVQLASLTGSIFPDEKADEKYVHEFAQCLVVAMRSCQTQLDACNLSQMIAKLFTFHSLQLLFRLPEETIVELFTLLTRLTCQCCFEAVRESGMENDTSYQEIFAKFLDAWMIVLRSESTITLPACFAEFRKEIFLTYLRCHISAPDGIRPSMDESNHCELNEDVEDDRERYANILSNIGALGQRCLDISTENLLRLLSARVDVFCRYCAHLQADPDSGRSVDISALNNYQEDMHWLLLIAGNLLTVEEPLECYAAVNNPVTSAPSLNGSNLSASEQYLLACITLSDNKDYDSSTSNADTSIGLLGVVLRWAAIELKALTENCELLLSPQVAQTSLWVLRRILVSCNTEIPSLAIMLKSGGILSKTLTDFATKTALRSLTKWNGETNIAKDATVLLLSLAKSQQRSMELAADAQLIMELNAIDSEKLAPVARCGLLKFLASFGTVQFSEEIRKYMYEMILSPISANFFRTIQNPEFSTKLFQMDVVRSSLLNLLDCFTGVIQAVNPHNCAGMFDYLIPILERCSQLLAVYKDYQPVVDAVLLLFVQTATVMIYLKQYESLVRHCACLRSLLHSYASNSANKYKAVGISLEEDDVGDLILLLKICASALLKQKAIATPANEAVSCIFGADALGISVILPLMRSQFLKYPQLCLLYFDVITAMFDNCVDVETIGIAAMNNILTLVAEGLNGDYGNDVIKHCLDVLSSMATWMVRSKSFHLAELRLNLGLFIKSVFEVCLNVACEPDLLEHASVALFTLTCCNEEKFHIFVEELIAAHEDPTSREQLSRAFVTLLPKSLGADRPRREKWAFRYNFESFLNRVQGLLRIPDRNQ